MTAEAGSRAALELREVREDRTCPSCGKRLPVRRVPEAWVQVPVGEGWVAAYRILVRSGRPLVAEVRVFPAEPGAESLGHWSAKPGAVPGEGVPGAALRALRLRDGTGGFTRILEAVDRASQREDTQHLPELNEVEQFLKLFGIQRPPGHVIRRPGRAGRGDWFYAAWALGYVARLQAGSQSPIADLAQDPPVQMSGGGAMSQAAVRAIVHQARRRGFLTTAPRGRAGGELTPAALAVLKRLRGAADADPG